MSLPVAGKSCQEVSELPRAARSLRELTGAAKICTELRRADGSLRELTGAAMSCNELDSSCLELSGDMSCQELSGSYRSC